MYFTLKIIYIWTHVQRRSFTRASAIYNIVHTTFVLVIDIHYFDIVAIERHMFLLLLLLLLLQNSTTSVVTMQAHTPFEHVVMH